MHEPATPSLCSVPLPIVTSFFPLLFTYCEMFEGSTAKDTFEAKSKPEVEKTIGYAQTKTIYVQGQTFSNNSELSRHFSFC